VAFNETFWAVTATAAPVIALAAIVSAGEVGREYDRSFVAFVRMVSELRSGKPVKIDPAALSEAAGDTFGLLLRWSEVVQQINVGLQAVVLALSLLSIADETDLVPPWIAVTLTVFGVAILGLVGLHVNWTRRTASQLRSLGPMVAAAILERQSAQQLTESGQADGGADADQSTPST
jgi:hypothetical protein